MYITGDIGGTNLRLSSINGKDMIHTEYYVTREHPTLISAIQDFISKHSIKGIKSCCLAMAGPVDGKHCTLTNENTAYKYNSEEFASTLGFSVKFINDFQAIGWWIISRFVTNEAVDIIVPNALHNGVKLYLGAGTGLGVGYVAETSVFPCEGGHLRFGPSCPIEYELVVFMQKKHNSQHISYERFVSGNGIACIAQFFMGKTEAQLNAYLGVTGGSDKMVSELISLPASEDDQPSHVAINANKGDETFKKIMAIFFNFYGRAISDLCAGFLPSEIFIAGGIMAKNMDLLKDAFVNKKFMDGLYDKGRLSHIVKNRRISVILQDNIGLYGCCECLLQNE
ncbi:Glucokinase [Spironucleus salmonicida]|uniref:Glucokinase n=1 Tax=Spironucleus salmonicida TaxID=348837 RepID=V6LL27_9EUKA|nr:Glucokinase [Spironucleus salmonicida]|eukprot:EST41384.1 Glucokinase [Spironucleus salmonicida]